jgi:hypothetical protein
MKTKLKIKIRNELKRKLKLKLRDGLKQDKIIKSENNSRIEEDKF